MDHLKMCEMKFHGYTGCLPEEKINGQTFIVSVDMLFERNKGAMTDNLEDTVNYAELYELIKDYVTTSKGDLIENLAYEIGGIILNYTNLPESVVVTVSKPDAPVEGDFRTMEVSIERKRTYSSEKVHNAVIALGSNMGDKEEYLKKATKELLSSGHIELVAKGGLYETEPVGYSDQPYFYNTVIEVKTDLEPIDLLDLTQSIENKLHRVRTIKNGPRTIDLDILLYDDLKINTKRLIVPHPRMYERAFVLCPLKDIREINVKIPEDKAIKYLGEFEVLT